MNKDNQNTIALNLVKIREYIGYSQETLAKLLNVDEKMIEQWELGKSEPTLSQALLLSRLYGIPLEDIFCDCKVSEVLPDDAKEEFNHNAWLNRISNRRYSW